MNTRLVALRKALKLTQANFGNQINLSQTQIGKIEKGDRALTDRTMEDICRKFNVNEDWLRNGTGPMFRPTQNIDEELTVEIAKLVKTDDVFTKSVILEYLSLSDESRELFKKFLISVVARSEEVDIAAPAAEPDPADTTTEYEEAAYRKASGIAENTDLSASNTIGDTASKASSQ